MASVRDQLDSIDLMDQTTTETEEAPSDSPIEEEEEKEEEEGETSEEEESEEESSVEEDEEESVEESKEFKPPSLVTRVKQKYGKEIFKEFPELEDAYFKWREVSQIHGTLEEVKLAHEKANYLDGIAGEIMEGNLEPILDGAYEVNPESVKKIAYNFLPLLHGKAPKLFAEVIQPVVVNYLAKVAKDAQSMGDEQLLIAVRLLNRHTFEDSDIPKQMKIPKIEKDSNDIRSERAAFQAERETNFYSLVEKDSTPSIENAILSGLDPKKVLPEGLRDTAVDKIKDGVFQMLGKDREHMNKMAALKRTAQANGYSPKYVDQVTAEVVKKAKELIPTIRSKVIKELGLSSTLFKASPKEKVFPPSSTSINVGGNSSKLDAGKIDWDKTPMRNALDAALGGKSQVHLKK